MDVSEEQLKVVCDQARAYGFEVGRIRTLENREIPLKPIYESTPMNPFINPDWDEELNLPQGFLLSFKNGAL